MQTRSIFVFLFLQCYLFCLLLHNNVDADCVVTKTALDGELDSIDWFGADAQTVFVVTEEYTLYRSINEGQVFTNELSKMANGTKKFYPYYANGVRAVYPTTDPSKIWILGFGPALWTTVDGGNTYKYTDTGLIIHRLSIHPRFTDVALAGAWTAKCYDRNAPGTCVHELYVTFDFGKSWSLVDTYINQWDWGMASTASSHVQSSVFYTAYPTKTGQQYFKSTYDLSLFHTNRYGADKVMLQQHSVAMLYMAAPDDILWVATYEPKHRSLNLYVSQDDGKTLIDTDFPEQLVEKRYNILDASEKSAFINVDHSADGSWGKLYMSNDVDERYTTSLDKQKRDAVYVDFEKVSGLDGIYITNYYDDPSDRPSSDRIRTKITYDKGAEWTFIPPPVGETCTDCYLNLFGLTDTIYGRVYSDPGSAGLILATGNVGKYLQKMKDDVDTYFSRDAGWTWTKIGSGSLTYEFGDHGGIIVTAPYDQKTSSVQYSWDQGLTWTSCSLPNQIAITNIVVEPKGASQNFIIYGTNPVDDTGLIYFLNLTSLHQRDCVGADKPNTAGSDYEAWSPSDALGRDCLMGATSVITRRKQTAQCFNKLPVDQMKQTSICPCAEEDYECDYCYEEGSGNTCALACSDFDPNAQPLPCKDYFYTATGYRIVAGDVCDPSKGVNKLGEKRRCDPNYQYPSSSSSVDTGSSSHNPRRPSKESPGAVVGLIILIFVVIFGVGITTTLYLYRHNERFRAVTRPYLPRWFSDSHSYRQLAAGESVLDDDYGSDAELLDEEELSTLQDNSEPVDEESARSSPNNNTSSFVAFPTPVSPSTSMPIATGSPPPLSPTSSDSSLLD